MRRLSQAGFKRDFVRPAILPDWWNDACGDDASILPDIEFRIARFLGRSIEDVRNPKARLAAPAYAGAQLRRVRDVDRDRLTAAIHSGLQIAAAVARSMREPLVSASPPPTDAMAWRKLIHRASRALTLDDLLVDVWSRGIPVVPVDLLPVPRFQGLACIVESRPVILLGHKNDEPGRVAFVVAHEAGHVAAGDCAPEQPVVDEEDEIADDAEVERQADLFATRLLVGTDMFPVVDGSDFRQLARNASAVERETGADASAVIFAWARRTGDYQNATMAVKALYRGTGARNLLRKHFDLHVDLNAATESDRGLLRCVYGDPELDGTAD